MNTINKLTFKDIVKILRNHQNDKLMSVFLICIIITLLYSLIPVSANFLYRVGKFVSDLLLGYVIGYIIYFITSIVPFDTNVIATNKLLKKRFKKLKEKLNELLTNIIGDEEWEVKDRKKLISSVRANMKDFDVNETVIAYPDEGGVLRARPTKLECYYYLVIQIEDIIKNVERDSEYIINKELLHNLYSIQESNFHKWIKRLYSIPGYAPHEFNKKIDYQLFNLRSKTEEDDYTGCVKQLFSEMDNQLNYG